MAARLGLDDCTRLACRTRVRGDVTERRLVIDTLDERLASLLHHEAAAVGREVDVAILFAETLMDYATRGWLNYVPMGQ